MVYFYRYSLCKYGKMTKMSNKKIITILVAVSTVALAAFFLIYKGVTFSYKACVADEDELEEITSSRTPSDYIMCDVYFNGEKLFYDKVNNVYYYSLVEGDFKALNPEVIVLSDYSDERIVFSDNITSEGIAANKTISMIVYSDNSYFEAGLKCTTLPIMSIDTVEEISQSPEVSVGMSMTLFDNRVGITKRVQTSDGMTHVRGATTLANPKKNLRISLTTGTEENAKKNKLSLLGLRKDDDYILNSMCVDPEDVRDVFCTNLWKKTASTDNSYDLDLGVEYKYVEVILNGEYHGLYALGYPIQGGQLGIGNNDENAVMFRQRIPYHEGTILLEPDGALSQFRIESKHDSSFNSCLRNYLIELDDSHDDPVALAKLIDMDNAIDFYLYVTMIQGWDNIYKNHNVVLEKNGDSYKMIYIPWDMDLTWGLGPGYTLYEIGANAYYPYDFEALYMLLQTDTDNTKTIIGQKYRGLRKNEWSDKKIIDLLDAYEELIFNSGAYLRDTQRWPENVSVDPVEKLVNFKSYVLERLQAMDEFVENIDDYLVDPEYSYENISFGSDVVADCAGQLFPEETDELVLMQICNQELWSDEYYYDVMERLGIPDSYIDKEITLKKYIEKKFVDFTKEDCEEASIQLIAGADLVVSNNGIDISSYSGFFNEQNSIETELGELAYYLGEDGLCGLYLNGNEILTENVYERDFDIRLIHIDRETQEVTDIEEYNIEG